MTCNGWKTTLVVLAFALAAAAPASAGVEQQQLQAVHDLSALIFGVPGTVMPANPCPGACPCANKCACGTNCVCSHLSGGSPNQKLLGRTWYYGWVMRNNRPTAEKECARQYLMDHLNAQQTWGHYSLNANTDEVLTTSHLQLWAGGMAGAYLFALNSGANVGSGTPLVSDETVKTAVRKWWLDEENLWTTLANGGTTIDAPGARFNATAGTTLDLRDKIYGQLNGVRPTKPPNWATDAWFTGGWIFEELYARQHDPSVYVMAPVSGYTPGPRLHDTLCMYRNSSTGEWLYYFPKLRAASDPIFWVQNRTPHNPSYVPGVPVYPPVKPANFPGATTIPIPGLTSAGADPTCPSPSALQ